MYLLQWRSHDICNSYRTRGSASTTLASNPDFTMDIKWRPNTIPKLHSLGPIGPPIWIFINTTRRVGILTVL